MKSTYYFHIACKRTMECMFVYLCSKMRTAEKSKKQFIHVNYSLLCLVSCCLGFLGGGGLFVYLFLHLRKLYNPARLGPRACEVFKVSWLQTYLSILPFPMSHFVSILAKTITDTSQEKLHILQYLKIYKRKILQCHFTE